MPPRMVTLEATPEHVFDSSPRPVDQVIAQMRNGDPGRVSRRLAMSVAAVQRGRNELCSIATLPLRLYRGLTAVDHPLFRQFDNDVPNVVHLSLTIEDLVFEGIAWWEITGVDFYGYPIMVRRIDPTTVTLRPPGTMAPLNPSEIEQQGKWVWIDRLDGRGPQPVLSTTMIRFDSPNPGVLTANARAIRRAIALDQVAAMYADNPALREYFTDNDDASVDQLSDTEVDEFLADYLSARRSSPVAWIPNAVKRADVSAPSPRDLTLVDLQRQVTLEIANGIGVDPEDLGVSTTSRTYFNSVDKKTDKINRTYAPFMTAITQRLGMPDVTMRGYTPAFDLTDYLKSSPGEQADYWSKLQEMGVVDAQWIAGQAGIAPEVTRRAQAAPAPAAPADAATSRSRLRVASAGAEPALTFSWHDFADAPAAPVVDQAARTITGLAVPYNAVADKYGLKYSFKPGSLEYSDPARMAHLKDHMTPVGFHRSVTDTAAGPMVELAVLDGPEGSPAKAERDQLLYDAEHGLYSGLSIGVDFDLDPESGDVQFDADTGVYNVLRATWRETSTTYMPAFDDARVTKVAASLTGGSPMDQCPHCGHRHAPGIACATFAARLAATPAPAPAAAPAGPGVVAVPNPDPATVPGWEAFQAFMAQQPTEPVPAPAVVSPHRQATAQVIEPSPYRFDRRGNLRAGSHDFSSDLFLGWKDGGDQAARDRAQSFVEQQFAENQVGNLAPLTPAQQFAITPANVVNLNYPQNHPEMYVDQLDYQYPMYAAMDKGTLDAVTPFVIPKFNSSSGLVADHVTGTEPTPGTFTATAQTITPSALSGKVEITREAFDQGGNPQMSGLIWRQMTRAWYEGLEAYAQAQLVAAAASIPDITITTALADSALDQALSDAMVPLQYIRGGDRYRKVFTQIDLYKAMVKAKDGNNRRLYPSIGAQNAIGTADPAYGWLDAHGKLWVPAWATAATGTVAASSWMFDPEVVCLWASAPKRIDIVWRVAWVDLGIWGYKAFGITDFTRTREIVYDPI